jgi:hypothetical protein
MAKTPIDRGGRKGSCFALTVDARQYRVTANHLAPHGDAVTAVRL